MTRKAKSAAKRGQLSDAQLCRLAQSQEGVVGAKLLTPDQVVTAGWVRLKCQFGCGGWGRCRTCPPYTPTPEQMRGVLDGYRRALLLHFSPEAEVRAVVVELEREIFLRGAWKALALGAGPCQLCKNCVLENGACLHPDQARPAMEACGIDVYSTAHNAGFPIEVVRDADDPQNYYGLVLVD